MNDVSKGQPADRPPPRPKPAFEDDEGVRRVAATLGSSGPVAFRPDQVLVQIDAFDGADPLEQIGEVSGGNVVDPSRLDLRQAEASGWLRVKIDGGVDTVAVVSALNERFPGAARLNTVLTVGALTADPMRFTSLYGADPMRFTSDVGADPMRFTNFSTARPAVAPPRPTTDHAAGDPVVAIFDTGQPPAGDLVPPSLDVPSQMGPGVRERPDENGDHYLDVAAGHAAFIQGIIERAAPSAAFYCDGVIHNDGDGEEADIANALQELAELDDLDHTRLVVNLSFSGYYDRDEAPPMISHWIRQIVERGGVVVAAAGNDASCRPKYPGALPEVVAVGSVGPCGASRFSNHGSWVDASAPGEDLVSTFFRYDGAFPRQDGEDAVDPDRFAGGAMWSGTSFAAPTVVGAIVREMARTGASASDARHAVLDRAGLLRIPDLGVLVNVVF